MLLNTEVLMAKMRQFKSVSHRFSPAVLGFVFLALLAFPLSWAQNTPQPQPAQQPAQAPPDSSGPGADSGTIAQPNKKEKPANVPPPAPVAAKVKNPEGMANFS